MPTLDWIGKKAVLNHHNEVPFRLLKRNNALSVGDPGSGNLLVQGDNLEALKALLPYYAGQVKCIYIDPPYNTGNENWVYNDNVNSPEIREWLGKVVGKEAEDLSRHDKWLCMMLPRLSILKQFLKEDGIIFVSIDEFEHRYLELLMDEVFGAQNRVETIIWKKSYGGGAKSNHIVNLHEYVICFAKNIDKIDVFELPSDEAVLKYYKYKDDKYETRGPYRLQPLATNSMDNRPNLRYPVLVNNIEIWPEKQWQWSKSRVDEAIKNDELVFSKSKDKWTVNYKQYLKNEQGETRASKPSSIIDNIFTQQGTKQIKDIFGDGKAFSFPKPSRLIQLLLQFSSGKEDLILDSFAGSGTTANAVLDLNALDGGRRQFILVEMDKNICENITRKRIVSILESHKTSDGFSYSNLDVSLFDSTGRLREEVVFRDISRHVYFSETGEPIPTGKNGRTPLLGVYQERAIYLLYNGILKDKSVGGGNVLTGRILAELPPYDGQKVIYGTACRISAKRLKQENIVFKQTPYEIRIK